MFSIKKTLLFFILIFCSYTSISKESEQIFELNEIYNGSYFFNAIVVEDKLFLGTSDGVQYYSKETKKLKLINSDVIGAVDYFNGEFIKISTPVDNNYSNLLPINYSKSKTNSLVFRSSIYLISRGTLFVFNLKSYNYKPYPSIRSISENYIGSYNGIYSLIDKEILEFPTYTSSFIREFDSLTFINWDGLTIIDNEGQRNYYSSSGDGIKIKDEIIGLANDIEKIDNNNFLLFTSYGLYLLNVNNQHIKKVLSASKYGKLNFIRSEKDINGVSRLFIHNNTDIFQYHPKTNELFSIATFDSPIIDVFSNSASVYYIISGKAAKKIHLVDKKENYTLFEDVTLSNNIGVFKNFVFVTSDLGLFLFDLKTKIGKELIIKEEFNKNAFYIGEYELKLGSINGLYEFDNNTLTNLFNDHVTIQNDENIIIKKGELIAYGLLILLLVAGIFQLFITKLKTNNRKKLEYKGVNKAQIINYIKININSVSIKSICDHFELPLNKLYNLLGEEKPGNIIREERLKIIMQMKIQNNSVEDISKSTGFSISYIKKLLLNK